MVGAIDEVVSRRRASRLLALAEASLWVAASLFVVHLWGGFTAPSAGFALTGASLAGGVMLGLGALLNRACVFGAIARFGSGEWAYLLTPVGFFLGCATVAPFAGELAPAPRPAVSALFALPLWAGAPFALFLAWRLFEVARSARRGEFTAHIWSPRQATALIGLAFVAMMLTVGAWAYTELLADLARRGMASNMLPRALLFLALLGGAIAGGWTAGRLNPVWPGPSALARCLLGGWLMGVGSLLIPGGNDGLILVGLPLLQPHAYAAILGMALAIAVGLLLQRRLTPRVASTAA
jgi:toxin CptA